MAADVPHDDPARRREDEDDGNVASRFRDPMEITPRTRLAPDIYIGAVTSL